MKSMLACAIVLAFCQSALAQCCQHCGCQSNCQKVCRVVCEVKKVPKVTYDCKCEEFCVPGPSCRTTVCDECGNKKHIYTPTCGEVRTRTKMVKHETFEEKVTYKWVVETLCCGCAERCAATPHMPGQHEGPAMATQIPAVSDNTVAQSVEYREPQQTAIEPAASQEQPSRFDVRKIFRSLTARD